MIVEKRVKYQYVFEYEEICTHIQLDYFYIYNEIYMYIINSLCSYVCYVPNETILHENVKYSTYVV